MMFYVLLDGRKNKKHVLHILLIGTIMYVYMQMGIQNMDENQSLSATNLFFSFCLLKMHTVQSLMNYITCCFHYLVTDLVFLFIYWFKFQN